MLLQKGDREGQGAADSCRYAGGKPPAPASEVPNITTS